MRRIALILLATAMAIAPACKPTQENTNIAGNANLPANTNANTQGTNGVAASKDDKAVAIIVTGDPENPIIVIPDPVTLKLHPTDPTKHPKLRWCILNNSTLEIDRVVMEGKPGQVNPFDEPLEEGDDIDTGDSECTKKFKLKAGITPGNFYYIVKVYFIDVAQPAVLDPMVVISG